MTDIRTNYCVACKEMADRIEELEAWKAAEEAHHHMLRGEVERIVAWLRDRHDGGLTSRIYLADAIEAGEYRNG